MDPDVWSPRNGRSQGLQAPYSMKPALPGAASSCASPVFSLLPLEPRLPHACSSSCIFCENSNKKHRHLSFKSYPLLHQSAAPVLGVTHLQHPKNLAREKAALAPGEVWGGVTTRRVLHGPPGLTVPAVGVRVSREGPLNPAGKRVYTSTCANAPT